MKIQFEREAMSRAFQTVASVVPSRTSKPILQNVKLEATSDGVTLMATDLELGIRSELSEVTVENPGTVVLPVDRIGAVLRESSDEQLTIEDDGTRLKVTGLNSRFQLPSQDPAEFPDIRPFTEANYYVVPGRAFRELIRRTAFATDTESTRFALGGVLLEMTGEQLVGVGTDGRRLAKQEGAVSVVGEMSEETVGLIVPTRAMKLFERALSDADEEVHLVGQGNNDVLVRCGRTTIFARLVEGRFPNWRGVFPSVEGSVDLELPVGPFLSAVRQAAIVTSTDHPGVNFHFADGAMTLAGHGAERGESSINLPVAYEGEEIVIRLSPKYLVEFLSVLDSDKTITVQLKDSSTALVCKTDDGYNYVIMPLAQGS